MIDRNLELHVGKLLSDAGIAEPVRCFTLHSAGGNNRVYRLETATSRFIVKQYFRHPDDARDRLAGEYAFLQYANQVIPGMVPRFYARNVAEGLALYEYLEARQPLRAGDIDWPQVEAALTFFQALNRPAARELAGHLPQASEACFALHQHLALLDQRLERLSAMSPNDALGRDARSFCRRLDAFWRTLKTRLTQAITASAWQADKPLAAAQRCLSPSDFGFHNAIVGRDGTVRFIDFEYAGWDDPAKTAGDFFAQLAVPVPAVFFERFVAGMMQAFSDSELLIDRAKLLRPVYQMKWCCIALNVFLPEHLTRRKFADPAKDEKALKEQQLAKAESLFESIKNDRHGLY